MNQSQIKQLLTLSNSSISVFTQTLSQSDKGNMLRNSERCAELFLMERGGNGREATTHQQLNFYGNALKYTW